MEEKLSKYSGGITLIAGSRTINSYNLLEEIIEKSGFDISCIVHGGASGVDSLGKKWALKNGIHHEPFLPKWKELGLGAGHIRNAEMVKVADHAIIIWDGESRGTKGTITCCRKKGIPFYLHKVEK